MLHIGIYGFIFSSISSFKITSQINWWTADNFYFVLNFFNGSVNQQITIFFLRISFVTKSLKVGKTFDFSYVRSHLLGVKFHCCCFYFLIQRIITLSHLVLTFFFLWRTQLLSSFPTFLFLIRRLISPTFITLVWRYPVSPHFINHNDEIYDLLDMDSLNICRHCRQLSSVTSRLFKISGNTRSLCKIYSKLTIIL